MSTVNHRSDGRFAPGNQIARGNPNNRKMQELRKAMLDSAEPGDVQRVGKRLLALAEGGDVVAAKVWLEYTVGKPPQALELSGPDGEPLGVDWERLQTIILGALGRYPDARVAVAMALRVLADDTLEAEHPGDGAGPFDSDGGPGIAPGSLAADGPSLDS